MAVPVRRRDESDPSYRRRINENKSKYEVLRNRINNSSYFSFGYTNNISLMEGAYYKALNFNAGNETAIRYNGAGDSSSYTSKVRKYGDSIDNIKSVRTELSRILENLDDEIRAHNAAKRGLSWW